MYQTYLISDVFLALVDQNGVFDQSVVNTPLKYPRYVGDGDCTVVSAVDDDVSDVIKSVLLSTIDGDSFDVDTGRDVRVDDRMEIKKFSNICKLLFKKRTIVVVMNYDWQASRKS